MLPCEFYDVLYKIIKYLVTRVVKGIQGGLYKNSIWYSMYGTKGRMECGRENSESGHIYKIYVDYNEFSGDYKNPKKKYL